MLAMKDCLFVFIRKKLGSLKPTLTDVDSAVIWMINKDLRRKLPRLYKDVKIWLNLLHTVRIRIYIIRQDI